MSNKINPRIEQAIKESIAETRVVTVTVTETDMEQSFGDVSSCDLVTNWDYAREDDGSIDVWGTTEDSSDFRLRLRKA